MAVSEGMTSGELAARNKAQKQYDALRLRVNRSARAILEGKFRVLEDKYKPKGGPVKEDKPWKDMEGHGRRRRWAVITARDDPKTEYLAILDIRKEFPDIARKIPGPIRPESLRTPSPPPPSSSMRPPPYQPSNSTSNNNMDTPNTSDKRKAPTQSTPDPTQSKKEIIDVDSDEDNDDHRDEDFDPIEDDSAKREERAKKRQRSENKDNFAAKIKKMEDEEDLEYQLKEIQMKADMQKLAIERKLAAIRRKKKEDAAARGDGK